MSVESVRVDLVQGVAMNVFEHHEVLTRVLPEAEHLNDIGMDELRGEPGFLHEGANLGRIVEQVGMDDLQRDWVACARFALCRGEVRRVRSAPFQPSQRGVASEHKCGLRDPIGILLAGKKPIHAVFGVEWRR